MKKKSRFLVMLAMMLILPAVMMMLIAMKGAGREVASSRPAGPCDIFASAGNPCLTAHSSTRALYESYNGPLYQVMRQTDGKTFDIGVVQPVGNDPGGYANAASQDAFCENTYCLITIIYDQSGNGNHLVQAPPGTFRGPAKGGFNTLPIADMAPITIMGHKSYGVYIIPGMGLRNNNARGLAINDEQEGIYMVFDGKHFDSGCCFNYGNTSTNSRAVGRGTMETVYFGTSTAWGSGSGTGPWIMSDMEAGLFSGYNARQNIANPTIDSWRFVTGAVNGGGGNNWEIWGGNAQEGSLKPFYKGIRPGSLENDYYYPMHRKGAVQLGNGGDNGNGSSGTFYEGVMTSGYPAEATIEAVQANIVAAGYDMPRFGLSRITTFTPGSSQNITATFTNTTEAPVTGVSLSISVPKGWKSVVSDTRKTLKTFTDPVPPGSSVSATFLITSPSATGANFFNGKAEFKDQKSGLKQSEVISSSVRNVYPVKINEIRFNSGSIPTNQFIELYNTGESEVDISNWALISTPSEWASVRLATIPANTKIMAKGFYLLGLSGSGLTAPSGTGNKMINVHNTDGFKAGQQIDIGGEKHTIASIGTASAPMTTVFVPVSTGPWITFPAGSTNIPVTNAAGFEVGQKIGIDLGGNYEVSTVTAVGKASTQTTLAVPAKAGDIIIKTVANSNMTVGDTLTINTGARKELVVVKRIINVVAAPSRGGPNMAGTGGGNPGEVELTAPLKSDHMLSVDVCDRGTGISFSPATRFIHKSGDAVQALGSGITIVNPLAGNHEVGTAVFNPLVTSAGYQGSPAPDQWYGGPISASAGSVALMDASGKVVVDAIVYGSQQSNSSANGTITSPEIAILEGDQSQGGCIVVVPGQATGYGPLPPTVARPDRSIGRYPDGADSDNNCRDFLLQNTLTLLAPVAPGSNNIKISSVTGFSKGQNIIVGTGSNSETAVIATVGTAGSTTLGSATNPGTKVIAVASSEGFSTGQIITIDFGANAETAVVSSITVARRRFGAGTVNTPMDSIAVAVPLTRVHAAGVQVSGSGITFTTPLTRAHERGVQVASSVPTPGKPNKYTMKP
jgi:hypothetical protein